MVSILTGSFRSDDWQSNRKFETAMLDMGSCASHDVHGAYQNSHFLNY